MEGLLAYETPLVGIVTLDGMNLLSGSGSASGNAGDKQKPGGGLAKQNNLFGNDDEDESEDE